MANTNNLIFDPSFEQGSAFWQAASGVTFVNNPSNAHSGNWYMQISLSSFTQAANLSDGVHAAKFPLFPGDTVTFSGWINIISHAGSPGYVASIMVSEFDVNNTDLADHTAGANVGTSGWQFVTLTFAAASTASYCQILCQINAGGGTPGSQTVRFDDVSLSAAPGPNQFLPIPRGLDWQFHRIPEDSTQKFESASLKRVRAQYAQFPRQKFQLTWNYVKDNAADLSASLTPYTDLQAIYGFWLQMGQFQSFLLDLSALTQQASDKAVTNQLLGYGDGTTKNFQLVHNIGRGGAEIIQNVNVATVVIRVGSIATVSYILLADGTVQLTTAPAAGQPVTADFSFYYRVCFDDGIDAQGFLYQLYKLKTINLVEDRI